MTERPLVSIIINNYNYGPYLAAAINSALDQAYAPVEVVVVDDGSTDSSRGVIAAFGDRIRPVLKHNEGQASAFNAGFEGSRGDIVIFLDADDCLLPHAAEKVHPLFREDRVVKVHWKLLAMDSDGNRLPMLIPDSEIPEGDLRDHVLEYGPNSFVNPPCSGNAWNREFLSEVFPVREYGDKHGADAYLFALAPLYGVIRRIDQPLSLYRRHTGNYSGSRGQQLKRDIRRFAHHSALVEEHCAKLRIPVDPKRWRATSWIGRVGTFIQELEPLIPTGAAYVLVDEAQLGCDILCGRYGIPFLEKDGQYWGLPASSDDAEEALERLRGAGASYLVFAWISFSWFGLYPRFYQYLQTTYEQTFASDHAVVFDLRRIIGMENRVVSDVTRG